MKCKKIIYILNKSELNRIKEIYKKELPKIIQDKSVSLYTKDFLDATCCNYHKWILKYMRNYKSKKDGKIKSEIENELKMWTFDLNKFEKELKPPRYKYKQKDWTNFLKTSQYFFSLHKGLNKAFLEKERDYYLDRVYLGVGFEFLLKAIFLKKGYLINKYETNIDNDSGKLKTKFQNEENFINRLNKSNLIISSTKYNITIRKITLKEPIKISMLNTKFIKRNVNELGYFIDNIKKIKSKNIEEKYFDYYILAGLKIAQSWRNQDIHIPTGLRETNNLYEKHLKWSHNCLYKLFLPKENIPKFK